MKMPRQLQIWLMDLYRNRLTGFVVLSFVILTLLCIWTVDWQSPTDIFRSDTRQADEAISDIIMMDTKELHTTDTTKLCQCDETSNSAYVIETQVDVYTERSNRVSDICSRNISLLQRRLDTKRISSYFRIIPRHRLVMCLIEKTASTYLESISRVILETPGRFESDSSAMWSNQLTKANELKFMDNIWIMSNALKIMFVRNPYTRLLSGYEDKILIPNNYFQRFGKDVINFTRPNATKKSLACGYDATFSEFVKYVNYIVSKMLVPNIVTGHFTPMFDHCGVCEVSYDFIGQLENMRNDTEELFRRLDLKYPIPNKPHDVWEFEDQVSWMYTFKDDKNVQMCMSFTDIKHRYWKKFQIKGLIHRDMVMPDTVLHNDSITKKEMLTFLLEMGEQSKKIKDLKLNKILALQEAYQSVPPDDLSEFQQLFKLDFELFGYDIYDESIFSKRVKTIKPLFFDVPRIIE